ncbi:MAG: sulfate adenylyltransferase [Betaproteobacteria bacterium]|nr:MAG: sulfate adenylyltransferase [Betaproteobacteria bacterium]
MSACSDQRVIHRAEADRSGVAARASLRPGWRARLALFALGAGLVLAASQDLGFSRGVTPGLIERYAGKFGAEARTRLRGWQEFVRAVPAEQRLPGNEADLLASVNSFFNRLRFVTDLAHWGVEDYWASPAEALASNGADCEDFTIAKYFTLKELGVPIQRLRLTYVKAVKLNQAHMVLAYYAQPNTMPLILDNLINEVKPASERPDLIPVYSFNDDDLLIVRPGQRDVSAGNATQIRLWRDLLDKLEKELRY